jgi:guanylate kinase
VLESLRFPHPAPNTRHLTPGMTGNLIIVSAPSGAGKTTLVNRVLERMGQVVSSVSYTARAPRAGEAQGVDYHFITRVEFEAMIARGEFLEWAEVHGNLYGTSRRCVEELRATGADVILTIDIQGAANARRAFPEAVSVFILPPSYEALVKRLETRGANQGDDLQMRLRNAKRELEEYRHFDYLVVNDDLEEATRELSAVLIAERCRRSSRTAIAQSILQTFAR